MYAYRLFATISFRVKVIPHCTFGGFNRLLFVNVQDRRFLCRVIKSLPFKRKPWHRFLVFSASGSWRFCYMHSVQRVKTRPVSRHFRADKSFSRTVFAPWIKPFSLLFETKKESLNSALYIIRFQLPEAKVLTKNVGPYWVYEFSSRGRYAWTSSRGLSTICPIRERRPFHCVVAENAWILTREKLAPGTVLQKAYGVLDKYKLSKTFFVKTDQNSCAIAEAAPNETNENKWRRRSLWTIIAPPPGHIHV